MLFSRYLLFLLSLGLWADSCFEAATDAPPPLRAGNPVFPGWYADPEVAIFDSTYWIFPTYSAAFEEQVFFDAFSSPNLVDWTKHARILDTSAIRWARQAMWAPAVVENSGRYFFFFGANDVQRPSRPSWDPDNDINHYGGIGIAVADQPGGPYRDYLGRPLIDTFYNDAQPIDQFVYRDVDSTWYLFYGGWGHCNVGVLNADFTAVVPDAAGRLFREITPEGYVEGPFLFRRQDKYYFMWSEGNWTDGSYRVVYGIGDNVTGPFRRVGTILSSDPEIATGAGHHSAFRAPGTDDWYIVYHRRPIPNEGRDHRVTCIDRLYFNEDGTIQPVRMTREGVERLE